MSENDIKRINIRMGTKITGWYTDQAKQMGIPTNALMVMALKEYMKQETSISTMPMLLEQVRRSASD